MPWNGQYKNTGGLKPVLLVPNLTLKLAAIKLAIKLADRYHKFEIK